MSIAAQSENDRKPISPERKNTIPIPIGYLPGQFAHSGRPHEIASKFSSLGVAVTMCGAESGFRQFDKSLRTRYSPLITFEDSDDYKFDPRAVKESTEIDQGLIDNVVRTAVKLAETRPPFVMSDHAIPINIAAKIAGVPLVSLTNTSNILCTSEDFFQSSTGLLRQKIAGYRKKMEPRLQEWYMKSYEQFHGKPFTGSIPTLFDLMEGGDLSLFADCPAFVTGDIPPGYEIESKIPHNSHFVGSVQSDSIVSSKLDAHITEQTVEQMTHARSRGKKVILGSFGTFWRSPIFQTFANTAQQRDDLLFVVTMRDLEIPLNLPANFIRLGYGDLRSLAPHADILACQGGSGTLYSYMKYGNGSILGITDNDEQLYNTEILRHRKMGDGFHLTELTEEKLGKTVDGLLMNQNVHQQKMADIQGDISLDGAQTAAEITAKTFSVI